MAPLSVDEVTPALSPHSRLPDARAAGAAAMTSDTTSRASAKRFMSDLLVQDRGALGRGSACPSRKPGASSDPGPVQRGEPRCSSRNVARRVYTRWFSDGSVMPCAWPMMGQISACRPARVSASESRRLCIR